MRSTPALQNLPSPVPFGLVLIVMIKTGLSYRDAREIVEREIAKEKA